MTHFYSPIHGSAEAPMLSEEDITALYHARCAELKKIERVVSPKFFHTIEEKLEQERKALKKLFAVEEAKQETLSHYSFVLPPYYFEQKFFGTEE